MVVHLEYRLLRRGKMAAILWGGLLTVLLVNHSLAENSFPIGKPVVGKNADGRLEVFQVDNAGELRHRWQKEPHGDWSAWSDLGGTFFPDIAVASNGGGQLEVFAVNRTDSSVNRIYQTFTEGGVQWSSWLGFGGRLKTGIAAGQNADGRLEVFAVDDRNDALLHRWQLKTNGSDGPDDWSAWYSMGGSLQPYPALGRNADDNFEIFAINKETGFTLDHKRQISANSEWLDWFSLDHSTFQYRSRTWQVDEGLPHGSGGEIFEPLNHWPHSVKFFPCLIAFEILAL